VPEYMAALWQGLTAIFAWPAIGLMFVGIGIGIVVGLLPGLGGLFALAVMLPFTFTMKPVEAFCFLIGMHAVTNMAGEITSVLFAVPGEGSAAAAILDGYPMAKKGQAGRAIGANLMSSLVGGVFGAAVLAVLIPVVRPFVLALGNPELLMLVVLGITFVASLSGKRLIPGILVAGLGFILGLVGPDPITGELRFTFDQIFLWDGIPLIAIVLGLFAIPVLLELSVKRTAIADNPESVGDDIMVGVLDTFRHWKLVMVSCLMGVVIGIIPGLGGSVAQWVAYGWAKDRSKHPEEFGKGSIEGVLAPGAATNSKEGGQLLPTVVFGVPGGAGMSLLLAAFLIVGLAPGPKMLGVNLPITLSLVWILVLSHIFAVIICLAMLKHIAAFTKVKGTILVPFILSLIMIGAYSEKGNLLHVWMTLGFGILGYVMVLLDWPRPPLVLAFILGRLAENYLWLAQQVYGISWVTRPIVLFLILVIAGYLVYYIRQRRSKGVAMLQWEEVAA
jgi:putative tricarboxylic transport membrane protein